MSMTLTFRITPPNGIGNLATAISSLNKMNTYRPPMRRSLDLVRTDLRLYPPPSAKGNFKKFATKKQKAFYFAGVRAGRIPADANGKYIRQNRLQKGWKKNLQKIEVSANTITGKQPNDVGYSGFVQGNKPRGASPRQQRFHTATKWKRVEQVLLKNKKGIEAFFTKNIERRVSNI